MAEWISAQDAADRLQVSRPRIHQLVRAGILDGTHVGGRLLIHKRSVEIRRHTKGRRTVETISRPTVRALREWRDVIQRIAELHGARNLRLFGSVARQEARPDSDIDLLIDLDENRGALDAARLATDLEEALGRRVDVIVDDGSMAAASIRAGAVPID